MMKKIFALVFLLVLGKFSYSQGYPLQQNLGSDSTIVISKGALQSRLIPIVITDTTSANAQRLKNYPGAQLYTSNGNFYIRSANATKWLLVSSGSVGSVNIYNSNGTLTGSRTLQGDGKDLLFDNVGDFTVVGNGVTLTQNGASATFSIKGDTSSFVNRASYEGNYSSGFTKYSLVDKNYVDSTISVIPAGGTVTSVATNNATGIKGGTITNTGTLYIDTTIISTRAWRQKGIDSVVALISALPSGTVTSVGSGYGLSGGPITTTGTLSVDSASLSNYYLRRKDSLTTTNPLGYVTNTVLADTASAIRASIPTPTGGTVTSVATNNSTGITGGTITSTGTLAIDTLLISTRAWRQKGIDSVASLVNTNINGTTNYISKFTGTHTIGNSLVYDDGTNVGIGTTSPAAKLDVNGDAIINSLTVGRGNFNYLLNAAFGYGALGSNVSGAQVTAIGGSALTANTSGTYNTAVGYGSLSNNTTGGTNTAIGHSSLLYNIGGTGNTSMGYRSLESNTSGGGNIAIGVESVLFNTTGNYNVGVGGGAIAYNTTGTYNTALGYDAGKTPVNVGQYNQTGTNNVYLGRSTRAGGNGNNTNEIVIGASADGNGSNTVTLGNTSITKTYLRGQLNAAGTPAGAGTKALRIDGSGNISYADTLIDAGGTVTSVATNTATGITGGTITTTGTLAIDTSLISTRAWRQKGIDSVQANLTSGLATKVNISDTASMLSPYARTVNVKALISDSLGGLVRLKALNGAGAGLYANNGTKVADWGLGGGANFSVYGFGGYDINRAGSYTVRSFTDKNYVDSSINNVTSNISGTINFIPKFTSSSAIGNSVMSESPSGNILINTYVDGGYKLSVNGTGYFSSTLTLGGGSRLSAVSGNALNFNTNSTDRMTLDASGNLGLGVTPSAWNTVIALQVGNTHLGGYSNDYGYFGTNSYYQSGWKYISNGYANRIELNGGAFAWYTAPSGTAGNAISFTQAMTLDASGQLQIGLTSNTGGGRLEVQSNATSAITTRSSSSGTGQTVKSIRAVNSAADQFANSQYDALSHAWILSNSTQAMTLDASGRLGIGTTSPATKLDVNGNVYIRANNILGLYNSDNTNVFQIYNSGSTGSSNANLIFTSGSVGELMRLTSTGLGIGTSSPNAPFDVVSAENTSSGIQQWTYKALPSQYRLQLNTIVSSGLVKYSFDMLNNSTAYNNVLVLDRGNVGIGTTSPTYPLSIYKNGTFAFSSVYNVASFNDASGSYKGINLGYLSGEQTGVIYAETASSASNMAFYTYSGSAWGERMRITSGGNVGIGTSSPYTKLELVGPATNWSNSASIVFTDNIYNTNSRRWLVGNVATDYGSFNIASSTTSTGDPTTSRLTITKDGNVGIGTTSPVAELQVKASSGYSELYVTGQSSSYGTYIYDNASEGGLWKTESAPLTLGTNNTERMRITSGGNLLVGTTTDAGYKLDVNGTGRIYNANLVLDFSMNSSGLKWGINPYIYGISNGGFEIRDNTNAVSRFVILPSGNVGIGTTSPTAKLQISNTSAGAATVAAFLINESATTNTEVRLAFAANANNDISTNRYSYISALNTSGSNGQALLFATNETGNSAVERMRITSGGNVGIGTSSPAQKLTIGSGHILLSDNYGLMWDASGNNAIYGNGTSNYLSFYVNNGERMRISSGGNLLVGTSTDAGYKLYVDGTFRASGAATFSSSVTANGNAATNSAFIANNTSGSSGTSQYYIDFTAGATPIGRIFRGNGASGVEANGLNIDNFAGFKVRLNQLGGSGGSFTIDGGNVGIGTTSPTQKLQIGDGSASGSQYLRMYNSATDMYLGQSGGTVLGFSAGTASFIISDQASYPLGFGTTASQPIFFGTNNTERMRITSGGNLLVGTTTDAGYTFDVNGTGRYSNSLTIGTGITSSELGIRSTDIATNMNYLSFGTNTYNRAQIQVGGSALTDGYMKFYTFSGGSSVLSLTLASSGAATFSSLGTGIVYSLSGTLTSTNPSDSSLKNTIKPLTYGLNEILQLQPKTFYYNSDTAKTHLKYGFIAQEVQSIMPELVRPLSKDSDKLGLESEGIYVALVNAIKDLKAEIEELKKK